MNTRSRAPPAAATREQEQMTHAMAARLATSAITEYLQGVLGQRLTAVIGGVSDAKAVGQWAKAARSPHPEAERRLRDAYQVTQLLIQREAADTVRAWFRGLNPHLDDEAPAPLAWPPREFIGGNRFDDPLRTFRVLYAARQRVACFAESLAPFRPSLAVLAQEAAAGGDEPAEDDGAIPLNWLRKRAIARFRLRPGRWLDLRVLEPFQAL